MLPTPKSGLNATAEAVPHRDPPAAGGRCVIRDLEQADLADVIAVERRSFSSPWSVGMVVLELSRPSGVALVAEVRGSIIGCAIASRYDRAWHLMKIAVDPGERRRGVASRLLEGVLDRIGPDDPVTLEVRPTNVPAIMLYERFGFESLGRRPGYYPDNGEDALLMWRGDPARAGVPVESLRLSGA